MRYNLLPWERRYKVSDAMGVTVYLWVGFESPPLAVGIPGMLSGVLLIAEYELVQEVCIRHPCSYKHTTRYIEINPMDLPYCWQI